MSGDSPTVMFNELGLQIIATDFNSHWVILNIIILSN